jgi:peptide/nickel transport system substrate-binding protein
LKKSTLKKLGAIAIGAALTVSALAAPSQAANPNSITVAEVTAGGPGVNQIPYPWVNSGSISHHVMFRALFKAKSNLATVGPNLASGYNVSKDGKTIKVTLKSGLKWSDGQALTADDVVWSINTSRRVASINAIYTNAFGQIVGSENVLATNTTSMSGISVNGNVITFSLKTPSNTFIPVLGQFMILPKHSLDKVDPLKLATDSYWKDPVVSGPFKVGKFSQGNFITLVPNTYYEGVKPKITEVNIITSADLVSDAKAGKLDYFTSNDPNTIKAMRGVSTFTSNPIDVIFYRYFVFNLSDKDPLFGNVKAREALKYAVDWQKLVPAMYPNQGKVINSGVLAGTAAHLTSIPKYTYDVSKAKALLKDANFDFSKTVRLRHYQSDAPSIAFMTAVAQQLSLTGMKVEMLKFQADATTELYKNRNFDISLKGLSAFNMGEWYGEYSNPNTFANIIGAQPEFATLNANLGSASSLTKINAALVALQKLEQQKLLKLPLFQVKQYAFVSKRISGTAKFGNPLYTYDNNFENWVAS